MVWSVPVQPFCLSLLVQKSMNHMRCSMLYYGTGFALDDFAHFHSQWLWGMSSHHLYRPLCSKPLCLSLSMIYLILSSTAFKDAYYYCPQLTERHRICLDLCNRKQSLDWSPGLTSGCDCVGCIGWEGSPEAKILSPCYGTVKMHSFFCLTHNHHEAWCQGACSEPLQHSRI